jgi:hypothetical protein
MTQEQFDKLKFGDLIDVDFNYSNIHIKGRGVVTQKYPTSNFWMDLEAVVLEASGDRRTGALPMESCTIIPVETPLVTNANSENCLTQIINVLKQYGKV